MTADRDILTFVPGTMCDERLWHPVWERLGPAVRRDYIPVETGRDRATLLALFDAASGRLKPGEKLNLVAFSMGGYLAYDYAIRHPDRIASLVTICASPRGLSERERKQRRFTIDYLETHDYTGPSNGRLNQMLHPDHHGDSPVKAIMRDMDQTLGRETLLAQMKETSDREDLLPELYKLSCPTMVIVGDADPIVSVEDGREIVEALPDGRLEIAQRCGHMAPIEQPDWLLSVLKTFHSI